jgi:hypothetical protein
VVWDCYGEDSDVDDLVVMCARVRPWARYSLLPCVSLSRSRIWSILIAGGERGRLALVPSRTGVTRTRRRVLDARTIFRFM